MRIHNPVKSKNKGKTSSVDGQKHGGTLEPMDQISNAISKAVENIGDGNNGDSSK